MRRQLERQRHARARELHEVGAQQRADVDVAEGRRRLPVDDAHHLLGSDAVGRHRGHEGARAGADVDVELVDGPVDREQVERPQGADLVDAAGEAAAAEDERGLGAPRRGACPSRAAVRRCLPASRSTTFPMRDGQYRRRDSPLHLVFYGPAACVSGYVLSSSRWSPPSPSFRRAPRRRSRRRRCKAKLDARDAPRGRVLGRLRARPRQPAHAVRLQARRPAGARVGREALHDGLGPACASGPTRRCPPRSPGAGSSIPTASGAATSTCAAAATRRSAATTCSACRARSARPGSCASTGRSSATSRASTRLRGSFDTGGAYDRDIGGVLGALTLNRGFSKDGKPAAAAARAVRQGPARRRHPRRGAQRRRHRAGRRAGAGHASPRRRCATSSA